MSGSNKGARAPSRRCFSSRRPQPRSTGDAEIDTRHDQFLQIVWDDDLARSAIQAAAAANLPGWRIVAGVLYNAVWNRLTGRPSGYGVNDVDLAYFDPSDLSWEAEDRAIRSAAPHFADLPRPVQIRNQARVHLWFEARFGHPYSPLRSVEQGVDRYASIAHAIAVTMTPDRRLDLYAPYGLDDIFEMRLRPNRALDNRETHVRKAARAVALWPEVQVEPW